MHSAVRRDADHCWWKSAFKRPKIRISADWCRGIAADSMGDSSTLEPWQEPATSRQPLDRSTLHL